MICDNDIETFDTKAVSWAISLPDFKLMNEMIIFIIKK